MAVDTAPSPAYTAAHPAAREDTSASPSFGGEAPFATACVKAMQEGPYERVSTADGHGSGPGPPTTYVFQSRKGPNRPISRRQALRILREVYDANELTGPLGTHAMRKTFANQVYQHLCARRAAGEAVDPFRLTSKALGHRSLTSTDGYLSFLEADIEAAILAS
jgi:integrase